MRRTAATCDAIQVVARVAEHETAFKGRAEGHSINVGAIAETTDGFDEELLRSELVCLHDFDCLV